MPPITVDDRLSKLEADSQRVGQILMKIIGFIDQANKQGVPVSTGNNLSPAPPAGPGPGMGGQLMQFLPTIAKVAEGLFSGSAQPAIDPMIMTIYKGVQDSYMEGFKSYINAINTKNKIADAVLAALEKGTLKLEAAQGAEAT